MPTTHRRGWTIRILVALMSMTAVLPVTGAAAQATTGPRFREGGLPTAAPDAFGGGEVVLELTVEPSGAVSAVTPIRSTPPFGERLMEAAGRWQFAAGTAAVSGKVTAVSSPVLVVGVFRPPTLYAGPAPGAVPKTHATPSAGLPQVQSALMPMYPPTATGDGSVIVEIEMTEFAVVRGYRIVSPQSGFDKAALDAVRAWRFTPPRRAGTPDRMFVYAVIGFRSPVSR